MVRRLIEKCRPLYREREFRVLLALNLLLGLGYSFVVPFLSMFGTREVGMSEPLFGVFMVTTALSAIFFGTVLAHFSDTRFSRRAMLMLGSVAGALGYGAYAYLRDVWALMLVGALILGVASITFSQVFALARETINRLPGAAAQGAFEGWSRMTPVARGRVLSKASQILEGRKAELAELLTREEGKTLAESTGEVQRAVDIFRFFGGLSYTLGGQTIPHIGPGLATGKFLDGAGGDLLELRVGNRLAAETDEIEIRGQQSVVREIVDRRDELARSQIAGSAENDHNGRGRAAVFTEAMQKRVTEVVCHIRRESLSDERFPQGFIPPWSEL